MASDAVAAITRDHRVMETLFQMLREPDSDRPALLAEVTARLSAHSWAEEEKVYPALATREPDEAGKVYHGVEEHHEATELLHKLQATDPASPEFDSVLEEFVSSINHHVEEEESELLPSLAEAVDAATLDRLGRDFEKRRLEILESHGVSDEQVGAGVTPALVPEGSSGTNGRARRSSDDSADATRDELYEQAKQADIAGRSQMNKDELADALRRHG